MCLWTSTAYSLLMISLSLGKNDGLECQRYFILKGGYRVGRSNEYEAWAIKLAQTSANVGRIGPLVLCISRITRLPIS
jgi:hypothetical protein